MKPYRTLFYEMAQAKSIPQFEQMLIQLLKDSYDSMVQSYVDYFKSIVARYFKIRKNDNQSPYNSSLGQMGSMIGRYITSGDTFPAVYSLSPAADKLMEKDAQKEATAVQESYLRRLHEKLWIILENKEIKNITLLYLNIRVFYDAAFKFEFKDGTEFQLTSQIVQSVSTLGKWFYRFPNIYQNIVMPDGSKIKKQSEEWMVTSFVGKTIEDAIAKKKSFDPQNAEKELRKKNTAIKRMYFISTKAGEITPGDKMKLDYIYGERADLNANIKNIEFTPPLPELQFARRTDGSTFYSSLDNDIRGGGKRTVKVTYTDGTIVTLKCTFVGREDRMFANNDPSEEDHPIRNGFPNFKTMNGPISSVSGQVISVVKK